jgi:hypothetical protein
MFAPNMYEFQSMNLVDTIYMSVLYIKSKN